MSNETNIGSLLFFGGQSGETLFSDEGHWAVDPDRTYEDAAREILDPLQRLPITERSRYTAITGALVVERELDGLLAAALPGFNELAPRPDALTLSMKTRIARALGLAPTRLFASMDTVRHIRNAFAHNLHLDQFED